MKAVFSLAVRAGRIELPSQPWQGRILPLNHARLTNMNILTDIRNNFNVQAKNSKKQILTALWITVDKSVDCVYKGHYR